MIYTDPFLIPMALSVAAFFIWIGVLGGIIDLWRSKRPVPSGVVAAFMVVIAGCVLTRLVGSFAYGSHPLDPSVIAVAAHAQRALLVLTGGYALWALLKSHRQYRANGTRRPQG